MPPPLALRVGTGALGLLLGLLLGVVGVGIEPTGPRVGSLLLSLGVLLALVGNPLAVALIARSAESKVVGAAPLLGWLVVAFLAATATDAGDVLLTAHDSAAQVFLWGGCLTGVGAVVLAPTGRRPAGPASPPAQSSR